jgi:uncharacterized membrane protein YhhN
MRRNPGRAARGAHGIRENAEVTTAAWVLLAAAAVLAVGDWLAVVLGSKPLEYVCKPGTTAALVGVAATLDPASSDQRAWFVAALILSLAGDVFLMLPGDRFVPGLGSFLLAQVAFTVGFAQRGGSAEGYAIGALIVAAIGTPVAIRLVRAMRRSGHTALVGPVLVYFATIAVMVASAIASGNAWAIAGAGLFFVSDALIAEKRFVARRPGAGLAIMVTYHLALTGLVLSLL